MGLQVSGWDWDAAAAEAGIDRDGRFNAGTAKLHPTRALLWYRADGSSTGVSGPDLHRRGGELAAGLALTGVERGDRVAGMLSRSPDAFATPLAVWRLGAIYVPLFSGFGSEALAVRLEDSGARALVVDSANAPAAAEIRDRFPDLTILAVDDAPEEAIDHRVAGLLERQPPEPEVAETAAADPATIMYTSGTSGTPKGCVIPHYGAVNLWSYVCNCMGLGAGSILFSTADTGWSYGLYTTGIAPMSLGVTRVLYEGGFEPSEWWRIARDSRADHLASAPTGYRQLAAAGTDAMGEQPPDLSGVTSCGEPLTTEVFGWFRDELGLPIHDSYGLTEVGIVVASLRGEGQPEPVAGSMGHLLPGFEIRLVDEDDQPVADGQSGQVAIRDHGWLLSTDYWNRTEEWQSHLRDGWWVSTDLARWDAGRYWYMGRADDVIVTAGYNVGPTDVEEVLLHHPLVIDAACVAEPDARKGHVVAAHVVLADDSADEGELLDDLRHRVGERVGWHAAPRRLHVSEELPRTESGKVRRRALRDRSA